jgi:cell division transport system permease protein
MHRLSYFVRETVISLRRNLMMTFSGIITIAVTATMVGGMLLFIKGNDRASKKARGDVELEIFMNVKATDNQVADVRADLETMKSQGTVKGYQFLDHNAALVVFKQLYKDQKDITSSVRPQDLPESFRVNPRDEKQLDQIAAHFEAVSGVDVVNTPAKFVKAYFKKVDQARNFIIGGAIALTIAAAFLVVTTVRLATYARRREIEVMKLVGASNLFVRIPFLAEGVVQGLIGGALAWGMVIAIRNLLRGLAGSPKGSITGSYLVLNGFQNTAADVRAAGLAVLIGSAVVGLGSALVGVRRFLDV